MYLQQDLWSLFHCIMFRSNKTPEIRTIRKRIEVGIMEVYLKIRVITSNPTQVTLRVAIRNPMQMITKVVIITVGTCNSNKVIIKTVYNSHNREVIILGVVKDFVSFAPAQIMFWYNVLVLSYLGVEETD